MQRITSPAGVTVSCDRYGSGPPLVLVHGAFSDHNSNWEFVRPLFEPHYHVHALARRGRGATTATQGHSLTDEAADVAAMLSTLDEPAYLLGHSYGAQVALAAAAATPERVRKLVLYEPPWPHLMSEEARAPLEEIAATEDWDGFAHTFFRDHLSVPAAELDALRASALWPPIVADARATMGDMRALSTHEFVPERYRQLAVPVLLQIGGDSPRDLYATDALATVLPDVRIETLEGQAHEGMTTAPEQYADSVRRFCC